MKYLKTYETKLPGKSELKGKINNASFFLETNLPISKKEGFIQCLYEVISETNPTNDQWEIIFLISFLFKKNTKQNIFDKFYDFLKIHKLKIYDKLTDDSITKRTIEIRVKLSYSKVKEFSKLYTTMKKYNL